jgi:hypothetical protein
MRCPTCGDEFRGDVLLCSDCGVALVDQAPGLEQVPTRARIGRFHPLVVPVVRAHLRERGAPTETSTRDGEVLVLATTEVADEARADLVVNWDRLLTHLDVEDRAEVHAADGRLPGWHDAPTSLWVDRQGRLVAADEDDEEDRAVGPALVGVGAMFLVVAWYVGDGPLRLVSAVFGLIIVLIGFFLPR